MTEYSTDEPLARCLSQLRPAPAALDPADLMYRAGFAAGQASRRPPANSFRPAWLSVAAMIALTGLTGYQVGQRSLSVPVAEPAIARSPQPSRGDANAAIAVASPTGQGEVNANADTNAVADSAMTTVRGHESSRAPLYDWTSLLLRRSDHAIRSTAFPLLGSGLDRDPMLEKLSLDRLPLAATTVEGSVRALGERGEPRRLMTAGDTAAWMTSY